MSPSFQFLRQPTGPVCCSIIGRRLPLQAGTGDVSRLTGNPFRALNHASQQPLSIVNILLRKSPFVIAVRHGSNHAADFYSAFFTALRSLARPHNRTGIEG